MYEDLITKLQKLYDEEKRESPKKYFQVQIQYLSFCSHYGLEWVKWINVGMFLKIQFKSNILNNVIIKNFDEEGARSLFGRNLEVGSTFSYLTYIKTLFYDEHVYFNKDDYRFINRQFKQGKLKRKTKVKKASIFTEEEIKQILELTLTTKNYPSVIAFLLGINGLLRPCENKTIKWENIYIQKDFTGTCECKKKIRIEFYRLKFTQELRNFYILNNGAENGRY